MGAVGQPLCPPPLEPFQSLLAILEERRDLVVTVFFDPCQCFSSFVWADVTCQEGDVDGSIVSLEPTKT